jgi:hypothetical protein
VFFSQTVKNTATLTDASSSAFFFNLSAGSCSGAFANKATPGQRKTGRLMPSATALFNVDWEQTYTK